MLSRVDLPLPEGPEQDDELALVEVEIDAAQRVHVDLAHPVRLREAAGAKDGASVPRGRPRWARPIGHESGPAGRGPGTSAFPASTTASARIVMATT